MDYQQTFIDTAGVKAPSGLHNENCSISWPFWHFDNKASIIAILARSNRPKIIKARVKIIAKCAL